MCLIVFFGAFMIVAILLLLGVYAMLSAIDNIGKTY